MTFKQLSDIPEDTLRALVGLLEGKAPKTVRSEPVLEADLPRLNFQLGRRSLVDELANELRRRDTQ